MARGAGDVALDALEGALGQDQVGAVDAGTLEEGEARLAHPVDLDGHDLAAVDVEASHLRHQVGQQGGGGLLRRRHRLGREAGLRAVLAPPPHEHAGRAGGARDQDDGEVAARQGLARADGRVDELERANAVALADDEVAQAQRRPSPGLARDAEHPPAPSRTREHRVDRQLQGGQLPRLQLLGEDGKAAGLLTEVGSDDRADGVARVLVLVVHEPPERSTDLDDELAVGGLGIAHGRTLPPIKPLRKSNFHPSLRPGRRSAG